MIDWERELDCVAPAGAAAIPVYAVRPEGLDAFLEQTPDRAAAFIRGTGFAAKTGAVCLVPGPGGVAGAVLGLGDDAGPHPFGALPMALPPGIACRFAGPLDSPADAALGFFLGAYRFDRLKSAPDRLPAKLVLPAGCEPALAMARATWMVRDLINMPANLLGPAELAEAAYAVLRPLGATVEVIEGAALDAGYPLVAAVGQGSARPARVVVIRWAGGTASGDSPLVSICGKGVCFDTGGYNLKPGTPMLRMRKDMAGAAIAVGLAQLIIAHALPIRLEVRLGCVENSISGTAMRPSDILSSRRGLSVSVGNTDAEGRLVLADLLAEASDLAPDMLLDFATLTGAARVALGPEVAALFCNHDGLAGEIETAARAAHDPVWRLPLHPGYNSALDGVGCDLQNVSAKPDAGAIVAALFLQRFVAPGTPWAHFDLYAWNDASRPGRPEGGDAQCLRAAFNLILSRTRALQDAAADAGSGETPSAPVLPV